jgi:hypothetical protein
MRIKTFKVFESDIHGLTPEQKRWLDNCTYGTWTVNAEGLVDVEGDFKFSYQILSDLKGVRFGKVSGNFYCSGNNLTSLEGAPREVKGSFWCQRNKLPSLVGAPEKVDGDFDCSENKLTSLEGAPGVVSGDFWCNDNSLTSLEGAPLDVKGDFDCENNPLQTLAGAPRKIGGHFRFSAGVGAQQFYIPQGQWGPAGWLKTLEDIDDPKARGLVLTLSDPDSLNKLFRNQPEQTMIDLQEIWNLPEFAPIRKQLKVPERYRDDMDLLGDMKELGF